LRKLHLNCVFKQSATNRIFNVIYKPVN